MSKAPITLEFFTKLISDLKETYDKNEKFNKAIEICGDGFFLSELAYPATEALVDLLEHNFRDDGEWISYWLYELDFGSKAEELTASEADGTPIPLGTVEDLYNLLIKNLEENDDL